MLLRRGALEDPPLADEVRLSHELIEIARAHALGERLSGAVAFGGMTKQVHMENSSSSLFEQFSGASHRHRLRAMTRLPHLLRIFRQFVACTETTRRGDSV